MDPHAFTLVINSDYVGGQNTFQNLRALCLALADQDRREATEFILVARPDVARQLPEDLKHVLDRFRIVVDDSPAPQHLITAGIRAAATPWVAILDGDCTPVPDWLQQAARSVRVTPAAAAISGRTGYASPYLLARIQALLYRSFVDRGGPGPTRFISLNNCIFQRDIYMECPPPEGAGGFAPRIQSERLLREGKLLWFDPALACVHEYPGWGMERHTRRRLGRSTVMTRMYDPSLPHAWLIRRGPVAIPLIVAGRIALSWRHCLRCARGYGIRWWQFPLVLAVSAWVHLLEAEGLWHGFRERRSPAAAQPSERDQTAAETADRAVYEAPGEPPSRAIR